MKLSFKVTYESGFYHEPGHVLTIKKFDREIIQEITKSNVKTNYCWENEDFDYFIKDKSLRRRIKETIINYFSGIIAEFYYIQKMDNINFTIKSYRDYINELYKNKNILNLHSRENEDFDCIERIIKKIPYKYKYKYKYFNNCLNCSICLVLNNWQIIENIKEFIFEKHMKGEKIIINKFNSIFDKFFKKI